MIKIMAVLAGASAALSAGGRAGKLSRIGLRFGYCPMTRTKRRSRRIDRAESEDAVQLIGVQVPSGLRQAVPRAISGRPRT
jgi:hypothetical protein